ncbi:hypothetical protein LS72_005115 [Helicobacter apodemus]|uniref:Uncharacterized protein n=1 Tax=Helicobacter apodemus TaxID=135569 RepID=A0A4U8UFG1_9HELI|nr:hypothetical protein [Helicobacter apodemus]TLE15940.1 hypothetical protein LS72_005115 [Helicobacter apodemus]
MDFKNVAEFVSNMHQNDKLLENKKESLKKLVKQIQREEARLMGQKIKAQKILEEILSLEKSKEEKTKEKNT